MKEEKRKNPIIGFVGLLVLLAGICTLFASVGAGMTLIIIGCIILGYALATGNINFLG